MNMDMKFQTIASCLISLIVFIRPLEDCISSDSNRGFVDQQNRTVKDGPVHDKKQLNKSRMAISLSSVEIRMSQLQNTIWDDGRFGDSDPNRSDGTCALTAGDWGDVHQSWFRDRDNLIYVQQKVIQYSNARNRSQTPQFGRLTSDEGEFVFKIQN